MRYVGQRQHFMTGLVGQKGIEMRLFAVIVAFGALSQSVLSQSALAQSPECRSIPDPNTRLACYDKAASPAAATARPLAPAARVSNSPPVGYVDSLGAEDARVNAQMKNICRGC
jgi:hypothetical protein